jgi:hypothetical protein
VGLCFSYQQPLKLTKGQTMTRKDYKLIAKSFAWAIVLCNEIKQSTSSIYMTIGTLSYDLNQENPRFDKDRFLAEIETLVVKMTEERKEVA